MYKVFNRTDSLENKITYFHLLLFIISLPFDRLYSELFLISLVIHSLIHLKKERLKNMPWKSILLMQSVYLLTVAGTLYTRHLSIAFGLWEKQLAILLFPLVLCINPIDLKKYTKHLLYSFALVNVLVILYLYYDAFTIIDYYNMPVASIFSGLFFSHKFSAPIEIHATYLSLYCALSLIAVLIYQLSGKNTFTESGMASAALIILTLGLIQLGSRAVMAGVIAVLIIIIPKFIENPYSKRKFITGAVLGILVLTVAVFISDGLQFRFVKSLKTDLTIEKTNFSISDPRLERWRLAWIIIKDKPLVGYGTGEEVALLKEKYFDHKLYDSYLHELNAHNQYLSFLIKGGMAALGIFLFGLYYFFGMAFRAKNLYFACFLTLVTVVCLSENILNVNKGIFFYAFFLSLFACAEIKNQRNFRTVLQPGNPLKPEDVYSLKDIPLQTNSIVH